MEEIITVRGDYITLGQALKEAAIIPSGGAAKAFLADIPVWVNEEAENRRGRKLYPGDVVTIEDMGSLSIVSEDA
ncbi:S4 domain-containing protein YaaA [Paenalkalicoccus suaedae]|uniref:S4 domain-containing protein YaaA n=1 Tax=Paenalkalicoccus suaedae TaxID=2592382 RepID=A0A859F9S2_9BACI|nr:S4 domain-containing protein YaaA [Paenalkalicoccus suaedae]QKS69597.1 S4 domain-containing protein YaaA [Paenalkalicoccus suaedae]